jgi:hypothetical protein
MLCSSSRNVCFYKQLIYTRVGVWAVVAHSEVDKGSKLKFRQGVFDFNLVLEELMGPG